MGITKELREFRKKTKPGFDVGDRVEYKSGKRGFHWGFDPGMTFVVAKLVSPKKVPPPTDRDPWHRWLVEVKDDGEKYPRFNVPCGWFKKIS
jgi:hypothetical protein